MSGRPFDPLRDPQGDIADIWDRMQSGTHPRRLRPCGVVRDADAMQEARSVVEHAQPEFRNRHYPPDRPDAACYELMARWLARGYVRAQRRYRRTIGGACALASLFMQIEREADRLLKHAEEGMVLAVKVNVKRSMAELACDYPAEDA
jgi:hypothetical protein